MRSMDQYDALSASAYYDEVVSGNTEALYYLLKKRMGKALGKVYELHGFGLSDDFEDTIDEFFLYLYDNGLPIQDQRTFFSWMIATYRNFLINKSKKEMRKKDLMEHMRQSSKGEECGLPNETMMLFLASAIAYADQRFTPRNRFVFYRMLLSFLDHGKAIPQAAMARALDMSPVMYRVSTKRQKDRFLEFITMQESGAALDLDADHVLMRDRIIDAFEGMYELLTEYYDKSLEAIPNAKSIQSLRLDYSHGEGMMHEDIPPYGYVNNMDISKLYPDIKRYLAVSG